MTKKLSDFAEKVTAIEAVTPPTDEQMCLGIRQALQNLVVLMNIAKGRGVETEFAVPNNEHGAYVFDVKFRREIVLTPKTVLHRQ